MVLTTVKKVSNAQRLSVAMVLTTVAAFAKFLVAVHCITHDVQSQHHSTLLPLHHHTGLFI